MEIVRCLCQLVSALKQVLGGQALADLVAGDYHLAEPVRKCQGDLLVFCDDTTCEALRSAKAAIEGAAS
jgi:hypothetical protein